VVTRMSSANPSLVQCCSVIILHLSNPETRSAVGASIRARHCDAVNCEARRAQVQQQPAPLPVPIYSWLTDAALLLTLDQHALRRARYTLERCVLGCCDDSVSLRAAADQDAPLFLGLVLLHLAGLCDDTVQSALNERTAEVREVLDSLMMPESALQHLVTFFLW
jgi:hypothetical protein